MANEKEYFVKVSYEWGKQTGESQKAETVGGNNWGYLTYDQSVVLNSVVAEAMKKLLDDSVDLGLEMVGDVNMVEMVKAKKAK